MPKRSGRLVAAPVVFIAALALLGACTGGANGGAGDVGPAAAIEGFDASPGAGFAPEARLDLAIVSEPGATRSAALELIGSDDPDVRIAAVYALSVTVQTADAEVLAPLLEAADPGERVLVAAAMLAVGDARAVPVLIDALAEDAALPFGSPPARVWEKARFALLQFTGQDLGLRDATTAAEAAATIPAWESWWVGAEASFAVVPAPDPFGS
jgi:hypothetical protein